MNLKKGIRAAKVEYKTKIEGYITEKNPRQVWHGLQCIANYQGHDITPLSNDASMAEELNNFFARFEANGHSATPPSLHQHPANPPGTSGEEGVEGG